MPREGLRSGFHPSVGPAAASRRRLRVFSGGAPRAQTGGRRRPGSRPPMHRCRLSLRKTTSLGRASGRSSSDARPVRQRFSCPAILGSSADEQLSQRGSWWKNHLAAWGCEWSRFESCCQNQYPWQQQICCVSAPSSWYSPSAAVVCRSGAPGHRRPWSGQGASTWRCSWAAARFGART